MLEFEWITQCKRTCKKVKEILCSDKVLAHYDRMGNPCGLSAILSVVTEHSERPVAYASKSLTEPQENYSQTDKVAAAIIFGVTTFYDYLYGR